MELVGLHVSQGPLGAKQATPWPANFLRMVNLGGKSYTSNTQAETYTFNVCKRALQSYLMDVSRVPASLDDVAFAKAALPALQAGAFEAFLSSGYVSAYYIDVCKAKAGANPVGVAILSKGDSCRTGEAHEA